MKHIQYVTIIAVPYKLYYSSVALVYSILSTNSVALLHYIEKVPIPVKNTSIIMYTGSHCALFHISSNRSKYISFYCLKREKCDIYRMRTMIVCPCSCCKTSYCQPLKLSSHHSVHQWFLQWLPRRHLFLPWQLVLEKVKLAESCSVPQWVSCSVMSQWAIGPQTRLTVTDKWGLNMTQLFSRFSSWRFAITCIPRTQSCSNCVSLSPSRWQSAFQRWSWLSPVPICWIKMSDQSLTRCVFCCRSQQETNGLR